jgi:D-glycero-alpha-D-manno-heptose-7-phosphate kinase
MNKHVRARAPMRLSFGGGGTEIPPYVDKFGGLTLSTTIGIYARTSIQETDQIGLKFVSQDNDVTQVLTSADFLNLDVLTVNPALKLAVACLKYLTMSHEVVLPSSLQITTSSDAPQGSGLGASSVLTVSILKAYDEFFGLGWTKTELAHRAYFVEREFLGLSGGKQDHFAASFGGCNFITYHTNGEVSVENMDLNPTLIRELESSLISIYTGTSRESAHIIENQQAAMTIGSEKTIQKLDEMAAIAKKMRLSMVKGNIKELGMLLHTSWELKKSTSSLISNEKIDDLYSLGRELGAYGGKIAGAGGGGFLILIAPVEIRNTIIRNLITEDSVLVPVTFTQQGAEAWRVQN